jgi:hypothetical protein
MAVLLEQVQRDCRGAWSGLKGTEGRPACSLLTSAATGREIKHRIKRLHIELFAYERRVLKALEPAWRALKRHHCRFLGVEERDPALFEVSARKMNSAVAAW